MAKRAKIPTEGFPARLHTLRLQKGLTRAELAQVIGIHMTQLGRYERGGSQPTAEFLKRMAQALDVSTDYLLYGNTDQSVQVHFDDRELVEQLREIEKLPHDDRAAIKNVIDAFLKWYKLETLATRPAHSAPSRSNRIEGPPPRTRRSA